jgi:hypothetical protein
MECEMCTENDKEGMGLEMQWQQKVAEVQKFCSRTWPDMDRTGAVPSGENMGKWAHDKVSLRAATCMASMPLLKAHKDTTSCGKIAASWGREAKQGISGKVAWFWGVVLKGGVNLAI